MKSILVFPQTPEEIQQFYDIDNIPRVIGIIDGTLIPGLSPKGNEPTFAGRAIRPACSSIVITREYSLTLWQNGLEAHMTLLHGPILQFARWLKKVALVIAGSWETVDILFAPTS